MFRRSIAFSFLDKSTGFVLALVTMAIVSRLMTPSEVGLFVVASSLVILLEAVRDFGVAAFLIQAKELQPELVRSAVTLIGLISLTLGLFIVFGADLAARLYGMSELADLIRIAALAFLVAPLSNPLLALLRRDMNFAAVARISVAAALANALVTIGLAMMGYGAFSFAWGSVVAACVMAAGALICRPEWWIFRPTLRHWRTLLPFGAWTTVVTLLGMLFDAMPRLILGKVLGFNAVGLFTRAVSLSQMPDKLFLSAVQPVVLPAFSSQVRSNQGLAGHYLHGIALITVLQWPALICLALLADPIVRLLLGPQWLGVIPLVRVVAIAAMVLAPVFLTFPVLVAMNRVRDLALISLLALPVSMLIVLVASRFGLQAVAWAMIPANAVYIGMTLICIHRAVQFAWRDLAVIVSRSAVVTLCTGLVPGALVLAFGAELSWPVTILGAVGAAVGWGASLAMTSHPLASEISRLPMPRLLARGVRRRGGIGIP